MTPPNEKPVAPVLVERWKGLLDGGYYTTPEQRDLWQKTVAALESLARERDDRLAQLVAVEMGYKEQQADLTAARADADALAGDGASLKCLQWVRDNCKLVYWPSDGSYPIEHNPHAGKNQWDAIMAAAQHVARTNRKP